MNLPDFLEFLEDRPSLKSLLLLLAVALGIYFVCNLFVSKPADEERSSALKTLLSTYNAYTPWGFVEAAGKADEYGRLLYDKEFSEGKTTKKYSGFTRLGYCWEAMDVYEKELGNRYLLPLYLPIYLVCFLGVALVMAIRFRIRAMRPLDFTVSATQFTSKR